MLWVFLLKASISAKFQVSVELVREEAVAYVDTSLLGHERTEMTTRIMTARISKPCTGKRVTQVRYNWLNCWETEKMFSKSDGSQTKVSLESWKNCQWLCDI